jgi:hypothetical protein
MRRSAILLSFFLASPAFAQTNSPSPEVVSCEVEKDCLARLKGKVSRKGDVLTIKLDNGKTKKLGKTCDIEEPNCALFDLFGYRPAQNVYVVRWIGADGGGFSLISGKTGKEWDLSAEFYFSPSGRWVADIGSENHTSMRIWSLSAGEAKQEVHYETAWDSATFLGWDGENRFRFQVIRDGKDKNPVEIDAVLKEKGWVVNWPFPVEAGRERP